MSATHENKTKPSVIRSCLQVVRFPAVFTAMSDIFLGFLLTHSSFDPINHFLFLLGCSSCLYLSGMLFNDIFDREIDSVERPNRPIPSGRVPLKFAIISGILLIAFGLGFALMNDIARNEKSYDSLFIAVILTLAIFAYDGLLKKTVLGPVAMGSCRFLNVMLGASATGAVWTTPQIYLAGCLGIYIIGLTWFARKETQINQAKNLIAPWLVINLGLAGLFLFVAKAHSGFLNRLLIPIAGDHSSITQAGPVILFLGFVILILNRRLLFALRKPVPERIQQAVKTMLLSYIILNSTIILYQTGNISYALMTVALLIPATVLSKWVFIT